MYSNMLFEKSSLYVYDHAIVLYILMKSFDKYLGLFLIVKQSKYSKIYKSNFSNYSLCLAQMLGMRGILSWRFNKNSLLYYNWNIQL